MIPTLYGIPNCDTVKKARVWLAGRGIDYAFHDYKKAGVDPGRLAGWVAEHGWDVILNRAGTTFRKLPEAEREGLNEARAVALMVQQPSMIKRPVLSIGDELLVGFSPDRYAAAFKGSATPR